MTRLSPPQSVFIAVLVFIAASLGLVGQRPIVGDDIWGGTNVFGNPYEVIVFTLRWDLHPPIYYSALDLWAIFNKSDLWLRLSSAVLHASVTALAFHFVLKRENLMAAAITGLIVFASPLLLDYSIKIRMYAFISLLSLGLYYLIVKYLEAKDSKYLKWIFVLGALLANTHAVGILFVFFHFCYGCFGLLQDRKKLFIWALMNAAIAALALPAIANSAIKSAGHAVSPTLPQLIELFQVLFVSGPMILVLVSLALLGLVCSIQKLRVLTLCYLVLPLIIFAILSYTVKPMWLERNFVFALPMLGIAIGIAISNLKLPSQVKIAIPALIAVVNVFNWQVWQPTLEQAQFTEMAAILETELDGAEGLQCVIAANPLNTFWSLQRYVNQPNWGNPVNTQPPINATWQRFADAAPDFADGLLKLGDYPNYTETESLIISAEESDRCQQDDVAGILVVAEGDYTEASPVIFENQYFRLHRR